MKQEFFELQIETNGQNLYEFTDKTINWIKEKKIRPVEHIVQGFMAMPEGLAQLYDGSNHGVALCKVRKDPNDQD